MTDDELRARIRTYIDTCHTTGDPNGDALNQFAAEALDSYDGIYATMWNTVEFVEPSKLTPLAADVLNTLTHYGYGGPHEQLTDEPLPPSRPPTPHIDAHDPDPLVELRWRLARHTHRTIPLGQPDERQP